MQTSVAAVEILQSKPKPTPGANPKALFPFLDLQAQFREIREEVMEAINRVMTSQHFILGKEVQSFEEEIAAAIGVRAAIGCASGSDALMLALMALGIGPGDEVVTTPFTFVATAGAIARVGATPVLVDIERDTFNINAATIEAVLTPRTKAIIPVHLFGLAANLDSIMEIAKPRGLAVVEDAAQAIGATFRGSPVGRMGTMGCFSFFPSKNLGGAGDGGMVTTNDPMLADRLRLMRVHGAKRKYHSEILGVNSRLDALQAAILRVKLRYLEKWTTARRHNAARYEKLLVEMGLNTRVILPRSTAGHLHVYNQFTIRITERDQLKEYLTHRGIPTEIYYPSPLHLQPAFAYLGYKLGAFPESEAASREALSLPIYPELGEERQNAVVKAIADFYGLA